MKIAVFLLCTIALCSCTPKDSDIKESIAVNAKEQLMFAGINYSVSHGVVTLTGKSVSQELKQKVIQFIQALGGVKQVIDKVGVAPVVLDSNFILKQKVDSVLAKYPTAESQVQQGVAKLTGQVKSTDQEKIMQGLSKLHLAGVENELTLINK